MSLAVWLKQYNTLINVFAIIIIANKGVNYRIFYGTETAAKTGMIMLLGQVSTKARIDYQQIVRETVKHIGYDDAVKGWWP